MKTSTGLNGEGSTTLAKAVAADKARRMWEQISHLVGVTLEAMVDQIDGTRDRTSASSASSTSTASTVDEPSLGWDDPVWGDWRSTSFQILGFDVLLDEGGVPHLLEVNAKPSLAIDTCFSVGHSSFEVPPEPSSELEEAALKLMRGRGVNACRCKEHPRLHVHRPDVVDLAVKHSAVGGALTIVQRDMEARKQGGGEPLLHSLAEGTRYEPVMPRAPPPVSLQQIVADCFAEEANAADDGEAVTVS